MGSERYLCQPPHGDNVIWRDLYVDDEEVYYYRVQVIDISWNDVYGQSDEIRVEIPRGYPEKSGFSRTDLPDEVTLLPNTPNPFNPTTQIKFGLPAASHVRLQIMNIRGQTVRQEFKR